jgi:trans-2,3-dihydro-3-hydroxyanthranilate isomerase
VTGHGPVGGLTYRHVDVFADRPLTGNPVNVFPAAGGLSAGLMQRVTQELRQFEAVFLCSSAKDNAWDARIFSLSEELPLAGHPLLGAAAVLHERAGARAAVQTWRLRLGERVVEVTSQDSGAGFHCVIDQGRPEFGNPLQSEQAADIVAAFGLTPDRLHAGLPVQVVSPGLRYAVVPVRGLVDASIVVPDLSARLAAVGAEFAYLLDVDAIEGRHWENDGSVEDVATGSAAGPAAAYLVAHGIAPAGGLRLRQGRFTGRPSALHCQVEVDASGVTGVSVGGDVYPVASGKLDQQVLADHDVVGPVS